MTCTAADAAGNVGTGTFNVTVIDTETPVWSLPADITTVASSVSGATVLFVATPNDNVGVVSSSCVPPSGSTFPLGTTTVNCTAVDAAGNVGSASFDFNVVVDIESVDTLIDEIDDLDISGGKKKSLQAPLKRVNKLLADSNPDNDDAVCDKLSEFEAKVQDQLAANILTSAEANELLAFAEALESKYGCS